MNVYVKLEEVMKDYDLRKPLYYYDATHQVSTCLLITKDGEPLARGIAICSPFEGYDKYYGRALALVRALRAIKKKDTTCAINPYRFDEHRSFYPRQKEEEASMRLKWANYVYKFKSIFLPNLTEFESRLVNSPYGGLEKACIK